jgi:Fe2+ transport system protein FeoA
MLQAPEMGQAEITRAPSDQLLKIKSVCGGYAWEKRSDSLGMRIGRKVRKTACQPFGDGNGGGRRQDLFGRGIASKIEMEVIAQATSRK